jgi:tetratricopeptide (TPR) repeat protein
VGTICEEVLLKHDHFSIETMARLLAGDLSHEELVNEVLPHLWRTCAHCREQHEEILRLQKEFGHWDERVAVLEGREAPQMYERLKDMSFDDQLKFVADDVSLQNWAFCQLLLKESLETVFEDAAKAINLAELAVRVALQLGEAYDPHWVLDLRAKAYSYLGNAQKVLGELRSAETAFREAENYLARSMSGNMLIVAEVLHLKASLRHDQRRLEEALALVDQALSIYRESKEPHGIGVTLLKKAKILEESQDLPAAIQLLRGAVEEIDSTQEPRLHLYARYNLVLCLTLAGNFQEAEHLLPDIQNAFSERPKPLDSVRLRWAEGKIAFGMGRAGEAEEAFRSVQQEFLQRGMGYDAALVSLDLAILLAQERRTQELKQLAGELMRVFEARDVHREAVAALIMFQKACEEERLTAQLAGKIASLLKEAKRPL